MDRGRGPEGDGKLHGRFKKVVNARLFFTKFPDSPIKVVRVK
jgi:hypothetical protein